MLSKSVNFLQQESPASTYIPMIPLVSLSISSNPTIYLNGLKGLAALAVTCHTFLHSINQDWDLGYGFGIPLFCVQAGYGLAFNLTPHVQKKSWDELLHITTSYLFNRTLQIFLPAICATFFVLIMVRWNLYDFALAATFERSPIKQQPELSGQLLDWWKSTMFLIYPFYGSRPHMDYIPALWALPVLLRDSMICMLAIIGLGRCRHAVKWIAFGYLFWQAYKNDQQNRFSMLGGIMLENFDAESTRDIKPKSRRDQSTIKDLSQRILNYAILLGAVFLMARRRLCSRNQDMPCTKEAGSEFWHHFGAILAVSCVIRSNALKSILSKGPLQYLGNISFTIYIFQSPIILVVGHPILSKIVGQGPITLSLSTFLGVFVSLTFSFIAILGLYHIFWRFIDFQVQHLAEWVEIKCSVENAAEQYAEQEMERLPKAIKEYPQADKIFGEYLGLCSVRSGKLKQGSKKFLKSLGWFMVPSWIQDWVLDKSKEPTKVHSTSYLDGLRGWASLCVLIYHSTYDYHPKQSQGYGYDPNHSHLIQLPVIRLIYSGPIMVWIFYAISGFALSLKPLQYIRQGQSSDKLLLSLSSSIFRRMARLYLPVITVTFVAMLGVQAGWFKEAVYIKSKPNFPEDYKKSGAMPHYSSLFYQLYDWLRQCESQLRMASDFPKRNGYNPHSWTIPIEFRGSMVVFSVLLLLAKAKIWVRICCIAGFILYLWCIGEEMSVRLFLVGVLIAESFLQQHSLTNSSKSWRKILDSYPIRYLSWLTFLFGLLLLSMPWTHGAETPGYKALALIASDMTWRESGVPILILSIQVNETQQRLFNNSISRYLGKISFALYLCQFFVIYTLGKTLIPICLDITGQETLLRFELGFWTGNLVVVIVTFWVADIFWRAVDLPSVSFALWLEEKSTVML